MSAMRAIALTAAFATAATGCESAIKHPAITTGIVSGIVGLSACELDAARIGPCAAAGGIAGVGLGLVAALVIWAVGPRDTDPDAATIPDPTSMDGNSPVRIRVRTRTVLPPDPTVVTPDPTPAPDSPTPTPTTPTPDTPTP
jgi:hypothetical protein